MNKQNSKRLALISRIAGLASVGVIATTLLSACGTSRLSDFDQNGHLATNAAPVFPKIEDNHWQPEGTFPNLDNLRRVGPGLTKAELYDLLGRPHFAEGEFNVREWDYVFNFRTGKGNEYITCQYKVLFDSHKIAQEFYWKPESCADQLKTAAPTPVVQQMEPVRRITLSADALFAFDKSDLAHMQPEGRLKLDQLAMQLGQMKSLKSVRVLGYTDRLGSDAHNLALSQARANTVSDYLARRGVPSNVLESRGMGAADAVAACDGKQATAALIACLQPNRRVEILIAGEQ